MGSQGGGVRGAVDAAVMAKLFGRFFKVPFLGLRFVCVFMNRGL